MKERRAALSADRVGMTARVLHAAIMGGLAVAFAILLYLGTVVEFGLGAESTRPIKFASYGLIALAVVVPYVLRGRIAAPRQGEDLSQWWGANLSKGLVLWALADGLGLGAMVMGWLVGDPTLLALGAAAGLAVLFVTRPAALLSGP